MPRVARPKVVACCNYILACAQNGEPVRRQPEFTTAYFKRAYKILAERKIIHTRAAHDKRWRLTSAGQAFLTMYGCDITAGLTAL